MMHARASAPLDLARRRSRPRAQKIAADPTMPSFTELRAKTNAGEEVSFDIYAGKVVLVVNVARL